MKYAVGDVVYNQVTKEEGRIVRITHVNGGDACIVALPSSEGQGETEVLWRPSELKKSETKKPEASTSGNKSK
jgi:hypothetical protein